MAEREFKQLRNRIHHKIRKYHPQYILQVCIRELFRPDLLAHDKLTYVQPWALLMLIKWTILESSGNYESRRQPTRSDLIILLNLIKDLEVAKPSPLDHANGFLFIRQLAIQQFWFQENRNFLLIRIARQSLLFGAIDKNSKLALAFEEKMGVRIQDFLHLMMVITAYYTEEETSTPILNPILFESLKSIFGVQVIDNFLNGISADISTMRKYIQEKDQSQIHKFSLEGEFYEESPLTRYPLLKINGNLICYSPHVLVHSCETFIYDLLRGNDPSQFMSKFGKIFENYIEKVIERSGLRFLRDADIQKHLLPNQKNVDFIILEDDAAILIDAKGVEMSFAARAAKLPTEIIKLLKDSVIKGLEQSYSVAANFQENSTDGISLQGRKLYVMIVTYKQMFVGNGATFYNFVGNSEIDKLASQYDGQHLIPLENMFFLGIDEFDLFIESYITKKKNLSGILEQIIELNSIQGNINLLFYKSLLTIFDDLKMPQFLSNEIDRLTEILDKRLESG